MLCTAIKIFPCNEMVSNLYCLSLNSCVDLIEIYSFYVRYVCNLKLSISGNA